MDVDDHLVGARQVDVELCEPFGTRHPCQAGLDDECLAEDARRLGERHRELSLERCAAGEHGVVIGVAQLVRGGLGGVGRTRPVEQHQRAVVDERCAERAAALAGPWGGVDPPLVEGAVDEAAEGVAVFEEGRPDDVDAFVPRHLGAGERQRRHEVPPRQAAGRVVAVQARLRAHPATQVGERGAHGGLHGVERRSARAVGEQRCIERRRPAPPPVERVGFTLDGVHRCGHRYLDGRPGSEFGVVRGSAHRRVGIGGEPADGGHRQVLGAGGQCDVGGQL